MRAVWVVPRALVGLLTLFVLLSASASAVAQALPSLTIGAATGTPGGGVTIPVAFNADGTVSVAQFDILFDPDLLSLTSVTAGAGLTQNHSLDTALIAPGRQRVVITTANTTLLLSGTLVSLTYTIDAAAPAGSVPLTWDGVVLGDADGMAVAPTSLASGAVTVTGGTPPTPGAEPQPIPTLPLLATLLLILLLVFTVRRRLPVASVAVALCTGLLLYSGAPQAQPLRGDANADGVVNAGDILVIVDQILGRGMAPGNADCNDDGVVNVLDTVCSAREIVPGTTAPQLIPPGNRSIPVNVPFAMSLFALDPDPGETLTFTRESGPAGIEVNAQSGVLSWTPGNENLGGNTVTVRVTDSTAQFDTASFTITVTEGPPLQPTNSPPQLMVPENQITRIGTPLALQASASDPDPGDSVTFSLVNAPAGMTIDPQTGSLGWTPGAGQTGLADVVVRATDTRNAAAFGSFTVDAREINRAPVARDEVYEARLGVPLNIAAAGVLANDTDPDGDPLSARLISTAGKGELSLYAEGSFDYLLEPPDRTTPVELEKRCSNAFATGGRYYGEGTVAIGDVDNDGELEIVGTRVLKSFTFKPEVWVMSAVDCSEKYETGSVVEDAGAVYPGSHLGLHDIDGDGNLEIIGLRERYPLDSPQNGDFDRRHLIAINYDGTLAWPGDGGSEDSPLLQNSVDAKMIDSGPTFADINGDGTVEIIMGFHIGINFGVYSGVVVYNAEDGSLLWEYLSETRQGAGNQPRMPYVVDLDLDGTMEIIIHNNVLDHNGQLEFILPSREAQGTQTPGHLTLGIANFDDDPYPELIGRDEFHHYLFEHDGTIKWQQDVRNAARGQISVADFDGDGEPEFAYVTCLVGNPDPSNCARFYLAVFDTDGSVLWSHQDTPEYHLDGFWRGSTNITAFDANRDGAFDLVFRNDDRSVLKIFIFSGRDGSELASVPAATSTNYAQRFTAVVDLDGDGHAEIINSGWFAGDSATDIWTGTAENPLPAGPRQRHQWNFQEAYVEDDAVIPTNPLPHWLQPGRNGYHLITPEPDPLIGTTDTFTYVASDGALESAQATVTLDILPAGNPPRFLSVPETQTTRGFNYRYSPVVVDPDLGDSVTFQLTAAPQGMTIDPATGQLDWYPQVNGEYAVSILALDTIGFATPQSFTLEVGDPVLVPDVVGLTESAAGTSLTSANLQLGARSFRSDPLAPSGQVLAQSPPAGAVADFGGAVRVTLSSGAGPADTDADGDGFTPNQGDCDDNDPSVYPGAPEIDGDGIDQNCNGIDGNKTLVSIQISPASKRILTDERLPLVATGIFEDGTAQNLTAVATWTRGPAFQEGTSGSYMAQASFQGINGSVSLEVMERLAEDLAPIARIEAPANGAELTAPTMVTGTASDENLLRWELAWQSAGEDDFVAFAEGANTLNSQAIGEFDPTTLLNGLYTLRLRVFDRAGNVSEDTTTVMVDSRLKVGNFTLRYVDLELPLNGIPITLVRTYDSRDKRRGDFGVGWRLGVESIELKTNRELGSGWEVFRQGLTFGLVETDLHLAALRLPGGRIEAFKMVVTPSVSPIVPFPPLSQSVRFEPLPGTLGTLQSLEENNVSILEAQPGPVSLRLDSNGDIYNPTLFRYTSPDGMKLDIDTVAGMRRAETPSGQVLAFTPTSISHSNGTVVNIERDGLGRITRVTDPGGFSQSYSYDANGDLRAHSDQESFVTRFDYDAAHNIIGITDPLNRNALRNEYDNAGRLISATNANGDTVSYSHDVAGRRQVMTDPEGFVTVSDYDDNGNIVRTTDPLGGVTTNIYDARGNRLSTTNAEGETTTFTYDSRENLLSETNAIGATTSYAYDVRDQLLSIQDPLGRITRYHYDSAGRLVSLTDASGVVARTHIRDGNGNLAATEDARGNAQRFEYDARGYRIALVDARGHRTTRTVNANGRVLGETDARGGVSSMDLDARGLPTSVQAPAGNTLGYSFNAVGELASVSDSIGHRTLRTVDAAGRVTRFEDPDGNANQMFFDGRGYRTAVIDSSGRETRYEYDALGRQIRTILPGGGVAESTHDAGGRTLTEEDPAGNVTSYAYDAAGRNTALVDALGNRTEFSYDLVGNLTSRLDARGNLTEYRYDVLDRLIETRYADGTMETMDYDEVGNVTTESDRLGRIKSYAYDPNNNLTSVIDIDGGVTAFAYDENNNRISQTDANGHTTRLLYDANDRLIEKQYPDGSTESYSYDAGGRLARTVLPDGKYIDATFDGSGRPTGHDLNGEGSESFAYDGAGRLTQAVNLWGTVDYTYDANGRVSEIFSEGGHAVRYTYDEFGNRTSISTRLLGNSERFTSYTYDALNRLATVTEPDGDTTTYNYDPVGNVASIAYPNGVVSSFIYDDVNQLTRIEHRQGATILAAYDYTLDAGGRRLRVDHANGDSVSYSYDSADRVLQETHRNDVGVVIFEQVFSYDAVGNRVTQQISGQAQTLFSYDSADKLLSAGPASFYYDSNGRLVSQTAPQGTIGYTYDVEGQLLRVTTSMGTVTYAYDANGKRRQRIANGNQQNYLLDEASLTGYDQTLVAYDGSGNQLVEYHWGDRLLSADDGGSERFYHFDGSRNTRLLTDEAGAVSDTYEYTAFGKVRARTGLADNPYGFAGEWQASQEGLVYLRARYYDPSTGRFISRDPFAGNATDPVSLHRYLYANANPIMNVDPSGEFSVTVSELAVAGGISAGISLIVSGLNGESFQEAIPKAIIAAAFGAAGGVLGAGAAVATTSVTTRLFARVILGEVTRKGIVVVAHASAQATVSAVWGVLQLNATLRQSGQDSNFNLNAAEAMKLFLITFVAEFVTKGYYRPEVGGVVDKVKTVKLAAPAAQRQAAATAAIGAGSNRAGRRLFSQWSESNEDILTFIARVASGSEKSGARSASRAIQAQLDQMSSEARQIIGQEFVGTVKLFPNSEAANAFLEGIKQAASPIFEAALP